MPNNWIKHYFLEMFLLQKKTLACHPHEFYKHNDRHKKEHITATDKLQPHTKLM